MTVDLSKIEFPDKIKARIRQIAVTTGSSEDEVVHDLLRAFFELIDDFEKEDDSNYARRVRQVLLEKLGIIPD